MPLFILTERAGARALLVRARCALCARNAAAAEARAEGPRVWRDPALSSLELIEEGPAAVIIRTE